jgi:hypothetical protein
MSCFGQTLKKELSHRKKTKRNMLSIFSKNKRIILAASAAAFCLITLIFSPIANSQAINFTVPCSINTYGNAWAGDLAFDLEISSGVAGTSGAGNYMVIMDTDGNLLDLRSSSTGYGVAYEIAPNTLVFQGEPQAGGANSAPTYATHIWNLSTGSTIDFPNVISHHDIQYNPTDNTFLTLQSYVRVVGNNSFLMDKILQLDLNGNIIWSWDIYDHIPLSEASSFNETTVFNGQTLIDFSHSNSLDWDYSHNIIYLNLRCTNTFYKINQISGDIIWACGQFGNFALLGDNGSQVSSLWYHSHNTKQVAPDVFTMFDNDYNNITNPYDCHSRMIELTLNETSMTAYVNWSWEAPTQYWNSYAGGALLLPNGDYIGDFGDPTHQMPQNQPWNFNNAGAVLIEVNPAGQVVKTFTFPVGCYIYRIATIANPTSGNFPTPTPTATPVPTPTPSPTVSPTTIPTSTPVVTPTSTATPTPVETPTPSVLTPTPPLINSQTTTTTTIVLVVAILVIALLIAVFYWKKRRLLKTQ